ncbi:MAG TPA: VF530 family protein [Chitinophagales bacterium]|nr:VF530 family protein [Chitinophagales bacterium]HLP50831.1 VF530 family protein [Chitinophagales bacterium]
MKDPQANNPLHGITLEKILLHLVETYGWEEMADYVPIRCFQFDPSVKSSLTFLRKTPWARTRVENMYLKSLREKK